MIQIDKSNIDLFDFYIAITIMSLQLNLNLPLFCHFPKNEIQFGKLLIVVR